MFTLENTFTDYPDIVSTGELMEMLHIQKTKAYQLIHDGSIKTIRIGRDHKIPKQCIIDYLNNEMSA